MFTSLMKNVISICNREILLDKLFQFIFTKIDLKEKNDQNKFY